MPDVDTSSYPKAVQPPNFLDVASKFGNLQQQQQQIQSNQIGIQRQQLDLINQRFGLVSKQMVGLLAKPDLNQGDLGNFYQNMVKEGWMPPEMAATEIGQIPSTQGMNAKDAAATLKTHINNKISIAQNMMDALNYRLGEKGFISDQAGITPTLSSNVPGGVGGSGSSVVASGPTTPIQPPPTTPFVAPGGTFDANGNPIVRGTPQLLGPRTVPPNLPTNQPPPGSMFPYSPGTSPPQIMNAPGGSKLPVAGAPGSGPITTGMPPLYENGRQQLVADQNLATNKLTGLKPILQALPLLDGLRTGPGTEAWNHAVAGLKAFGILSTAATNDPTAIYQEVSKYFNRYVSQSSIAQRSDAAQTLSQASSPNVGTQINPALIQLTKDAIAQDRIQAARANAFVDEKGNQRQDLENYGKFSSAFPGQMDERAFKMDMMAPQERKTLIGTMQKGLQSSDKYERAKAIRFFKSLDVFDRQNSEQE